MSCTLVKKRTSANAPGMRVSRQILRDEVAHRIRILRKLDGPHLGTGRAKGTVLEEHGQDGDHRQSAVGQLSVELALAKRRDRLEGVEGPIQPRPKLPGSASRRSWKHI